MLSIPHTLSLHRGKRHMYMNKARSAQANMKRWDEACKVRSKWGSWELYEKVLRLYVFHQGALRCFLRHARLANRKLVAVKRFARQYEVGMNFLQRFDDEQFSEF